jgi:hypothetical protein
MINNKKMVLECGQGALLKVFRQTVRGQRRQSKIIPVTQHLAFTARLQNAVIKRHCRGSVVPFASISHGTFFA